MRYIFLFSFFFSTYVFSAEIQGLVSDAENSEELIGALVYIEELNISTITGLNGTYILRDIPDGTYNLIVSYIGYKDYTTQISIQNQQNITINIPIFRDALELDRVMLIARTQKNSETSARFTEKSALQVVNVVSAQTIELSPDLTIANVVQRMSGVTIEKNSTGEAEYAIVRGMDKRYNYTLINGIKIPSPNNKHRFIPLSMFPSELADRVEVYKTLTPDMEGDGTGGVVNLVMKDSPPNFFIHTNVALGYNSFFSNQNLTLFPKENIRLQSPRQEFGSDYEATLDDFNEDLGVISYNKAAPNNTFGISFGNRVLEKKLGFIIAANYQTNSKGSTSTIFSDSYSQQLNASLITSMSERTYTDYQAQKGIHIKADYFINPRHSFDWYNAYIGTSKYQVRQTTSTNLSYGYDPENNRLDLSYQTRLSTNLQDIFVSSLHGKHEILANLTFTWTALFSTATNNNPERTYFNLDRIQLDTLINIYPDADGSTLEWGYNTDTDISGLANIEYFHSIGKTKISYKIGTLYRDKNRTNSLVEYRIRPNGIQSQGKDFETIDEISWKLSNPLRGSVGPLEYNAFETIEAGYAMTTISFKKITFQGGIRTEITEQGYFQFFPALGQDSLGFQNYTDILPSLQCKFSPTQNSNLRISYYKSINRPGFYEIVPYLQIEEDFLEFGNKDLQRARVNNMDIRFEYFPKPTEQILVGIFYKKIHDPIEVLYTTVNRRQYGYGPGNSEDATNIGLEMDVIKFFRVIGFKANYTYTFSEITTPKTVYVKNEKGQTTRSSINQKRPLVGQAPHTANISILLKTTKGFDMQIASSYNHDRLIIVSDFANNDYWMSKTIQFDASLEKKWKNGFSVFCKVNNIFNTPLYYYLQYANVENTLLPKQDILKDKTLIRVEEYNRSFLCGVRKKISNN